MSTGKTNKFSQAALREMDNYFTPIMTRLSENRYLQAIRNGMVGAIPIILVGSIFLIVAAFPMFFPNPETGNTWTFNDWLNYQYKDIPATDLVAKKAHWATSVQTLLWLPYRSTMFIMGLFVIYAATKSLADHYKLDSMQVCFTSVVAYLVSLVGPTYMNFEGPTIAFFAFGSGSIFGAFVIAILVTELVRVCVKYNLTIKLPKQVPPAVSKSFAALIPLFLSTLIAVAIFGIADFNIHAFVSSMLQPLQDFLAGNNIGGMFVIILFITLLWSAGIHGVSIIGAIARPFWLIASDANAEIAGGGVLYANVEGASILPEPFYQWFVWIGGSGATIGLIISMYIVGKSRYGRSITNGSAIPSIFNINEPVIFGFPIVLNPVLILPFILAPLTMGVLSYLVLMWGWVGVPTTVAAWTLPAPIGAFFATTDWKAIILVFFLIAVSTLIYLPFAKAYDKTLYNTEIEQMEENEKEFFHGITGVNSRSTAKLQRKYFMLADEHRQHFLTLEPAKQKQLLADKKAMKAYYKNYDEVGAN